MAMRRRCTDKRCRQEVFEEPQNMDEVNVVKDILRDALTRINQIPLQPNEVIPPTSQNNQHQREQMLPNDPSSQQRQQNEQMPPQRPQGVQGLVHRAQSNFRTAFPQFYTRRSQTHEDNKDKQPRKKAKMLPVFIKETWTHDFVLLSSTTDDKIPNTRKLQSLQAAGLGRKRIVFKDKKGNFSHLRSTLEKEFPKLESQGGAFELLRADRGGNARPLLGIPMSNTGYTIKDLKQAVSGNAVIYVRPIQSNLDMAPVAQQRDGDTVYTQCVNCHGNIPLFEMKEHAQVCNGRTSAPPSDSVTTIDDNMEDTITAHGSSQRTIEPVETIVLDSTDSLFEGDDSNMFPSTETKDRWIAQLHSMFPGASNEKIEMSVNSSISLQEAADVLCETEEEHKKTNRQGELTLSEVLQKLVTNVKESEYTLSIDRDEVWRGALGFYKKALYDKEKLWQSLSVIFKGEEGLDAGAMKTEFFELLLKEIQLHLFEGPQQSQLPVRESSKAFLLKLAGVAISHSIIQRGPAFNSLSPAIYLHLAGSDADVVASHIHQNDIPKNAGTAVLHELIELLVDKKTIKSILEDDQPSREAFWAIINGSHWPIDKKIDDSNACLLLQHLLENEIVYSRKFEIDQLAEGLQVMGLLQMIQKYPTVCHDLLCYNPEMKMTAEKFLSQVHLVEPPDFSQKQSYDWFLRFVNSAGEEKLRCLLQFTTGHMSIPPQGLPQKICIKYLADDDSASLPKSVACLGIINLHTVHSSEKKFIDSLNIALEFESQGFGSP